jgi:hypothetical protein
VGKIAGYCSAKRSGEKARRLMRGPQSFKRDAATINTTSKQPTTSFDNYLMFTALTDRQTYRKTDRQTNSRKYHAMNCSSDGPCLPLPSPLQSRLNTRPGSCLARFHIKGCLQYCPDVARQLRQIPITAILRFFVDVSIYLYLLKESSKCMCGSSASK